MKKTDAESIYSALVECLKSKNIQLSNLIGMGFDGVATFSGKKSGSVLLLLTFSVLLLTCSVLLLT